MAAPETEKFETEMEADDITPAPDDDEDTDDTDSSSDDNCGDDEAGEADAEIVALERKVTQNIYMYDPHVTLIKLLKKEAELDQLRCARERMTTVFPLSEELWLDWLRDEIPLVTEPSDRSKVDQLFQRAVKDYQSVDIWLEYVQYSIGAMGQPDGIRTIRGVFESAITAVGLHPCLGATIWEAYREFEHAVLAGLMPKPGSVVSKEQEDAFSAQHQRVLALFKRQLAVPLLDMNETYSEFSDWLGEDVDRATKISYEKALKKLEKLRPLEDDLLAADPPKSAEYQTYIAHELSDGDPVRIQCIFERTIKDNCLLPDIWCQYTKYLDAKLRVRPLTLSVYERAVKNCPWSYSLWQGYLIALERYQEDGDKIQETFDQAFRSLSASAADSLTMWTCYCDCMRRKIKWDEEHDKDVNSLRTAIQRGIDALQEYFGTEGDPTGILLRYWAFIEAKFCCNMQKCRELWAEVMTQGHGNEAQMWLDYYRVERAYGDHKHCSKLLQRALNSVTDWPDSIAEAYINYQREEGSLEDYELAVSKCGAQLHRLHERRDKASEKEALADNQRKQVTSEKKAGKKLQKNQYPKGSPQKEHAQNLNVSKQKVNIHKRKFEAGDSTNVHTDGFKTPAPKEPWGKGPPPGFKVPPPPGYKAPTEPPTKRLKPDDPQPYRDPIVHDPSKNGRTVFISNLAFSLEEEKITQIFQECGEISELRLVKTFKGKSKGYGYLEFKNELAIDAALKLDRRQMDGRPMFVSRCEEKGSRQPQFKFATNMEKNKLFIRGLPFKCTKEDVEKVFCEHGKLKEVRLVTYRNGTSKGLAFVEYENEGEAAQAVFKTDGMKIGEHIISVAISNPPERKTQLSRREESSYMPSLGGGKRETPERGKVRTQVSLVPRALQRQPGNKPSTSSASNGQTDKPDIKMSNTDFRNMLLKK